MKVLLMAFVLVSFAAQAEDVFTGGFGTDGATNMSIPKKTSVKDAAKIYSVMDVHPDDRGDKSISIQDESFFSCEEPTNGGSAGCQITLRASQKFQFESTKGLAGTLTFSGEVANKLFDALDVKPMVTMGATNKRVANLICSQIVVPGKRKVKCTVTDTNGIVLNADL